MKFSFSFNKRSFIISFFIDSVAISASVIEYKKKNPPYIHFVLRELVTSTGSDTEQVTKDVADALKNIHTKLASKLAELETKLKVKIPLSLSRYIISSSWTIAQTAIVSLKKDELISVDESLIKSLLATQKEKMSTSTSANNVFASQGLEFLEAETLQVRLNGYETAHPYGKKVKKVDVAFWFSWIPRSFFEKLIFALPLFSASKKYSALLTISSILRNQSKESEYVIVDVGGSITEWAIVKNGLVVETLSVPFGYQSLSNRLAEISGSHSELDASAIGQSNDTVIENSTDPTLIQAKELWVSEMRKYITELVARMYIPHTAYLHAPDQYLSFFTQALEHVAESGSIPNVTSLSVTPLNSDFLHDQVVFAEEKDKNTDSTFSALFLKERI